LTDLCTEEDVASEATWIQEILTEQLNRHAKQLRVSAFSKRWWGPRIERQRRAFSKAKQAWGQGRIVSDRLKQARNQLYRTIHQEKRECWESFLKGPEKKELGDRLGTQDSTRCWQALRYTKKRTETTTPVLRGPQDQIATTTEEKEALVHEVIFPPPPDLGPGKPVSPGSEHRHISRTIVERALFGQAVQKAPGPDRLNFKALQLLWGWDEAWIIALVQQCFQLGIHPQLWKTARGILLKKPGKKSEEYLLIRVYRVISLLNSLEKIVEKIAAEAIVKHCEAVGALHKG
jgi:hypothetical protein